MSKMRIAALLALGVLISACNVLPERTPVDLFQLPAASLSPASGATGSIAGGLRLMTPDSSDALNGAHLLNLQNNTFQAWPGARWAAPIPQLWRDWLLDAFWRDSRFQALSTDSTVLQSQLTLSGMLRALHTETVDGRPTAVIRFDAQLVDSARRTIIASQRFESVAAVGSNTLEAAVAALGVAADAPPGAEHRRIRIAERDRLLRAHARPLPGERLRGGDLLFPVQAAPER